MTTLLNALLKSVAVNAVQLDLSRTHKAAWKAHSNGLGARHSLKLFFISWKLAPISIDPIEDSPSKLTFSSCIASVFSVASLHPAFKWPWEDTETTTLSSARGSLIYSRKKVCMPRMIEECCCFLSSYLKDYPTFPSILCNIWNWRKKLSSYLTVLPDKTSRSTFSGNTILSDYCQI